MGDAKLLHTRPSHFYVTTTAVKVDLKEGSSREVLGIKTFKKRSPQSKENVPMENNLVVMVPLRLCLFRVPYMPFHLEVPQGWRVPLPKQTPSHLD